MRLVTRIRANLAQVFHALPPELRRLNFGSVSSLLVALIVAGAFGILGLVSPGSTTVLTIPGTLVVDAQTGTFYVPCGAGKLCATFNYASALLALGPVSTPRRVTLSQSTLFHHELGGIIGIPGLPGPVRVGGDQIKGPWAACIQRTGRPGLYALPTLVSGRDMGGSPLSTSNAVLATTTEDGFQGPDWLLWNGQRLKIAPDVAAILFGQVSLPDVPQAWLNAIPQGPDFAAPPIQGRGQVVKGPSGRVALAGQVYIVPGDLGDQYYVLRSDGRLTAVTPLQALLLVGEHDAPQPVAIPPSIAAGALLPSGELPIQVPRISATPSLLSPSMAAHDLSGAPLPSGGLPTQVPRESAMPARLCLTYGPGATPLIRVG